MIYCFCKDCGCYFPRGRAKNVVCIKCGSSRLDQRNMKKTDFSPVAQIINEMRAEKAKEN